MLAPPAVQEAPWCPQQLRVPREDRTLFARPRLADGLAIGRQNHETLADAVSPIQGRAFSVLRTWTRAEAVRLARKYTEELIGQSIPDEPAELLWVGGHQPALFHPGVWVKNFALAELAARSGGVGLNLVIDNDILTSRRIRVPMGECSKPTMESVPFDADSKAAPWEEARVVDRSIFDSFDERIVKKMAHWGVVPIASEMWPDAVRHLDHSPFLRDALTAARSRMERRWGATNLELPLSQLCETEPFLWFASHLFATLPQFREIYNAVLLEYRNVNHVRSKNHPVPELRSQEGWLEAPFWIWREGDRLRKRLMVLREGKQVQLSDGHEVFATLPLPVDGEACCAVEVLRKLPEQGIRLRTRALTTTLFTRLFLSDHFVHGIGGSKYDEITDRIITRFYRLPAPPFQTLSATLHPPLAKPFDVSESDETRLRGLLRDIEFNPERHLNSGFNADVDALLSEKAALIAEQHAVWNDSPKPRRVRRALMRSNYARHQRFQQINNRLAAFATEQRRRMQDELDSTRRQLAANAVLQDRTLSFCIYPEEKLRSFMRHLWDLPER
ncbi:MAG: hypothetical protein AB7O26_03830 [Planctomycetaceae bacterium]